MSAQIDCYLLIPPTFFSELAGTLELLAQIPHITHKETKNQSRIE